MTQPMMTVIGASRALVVPFDPEEADGLTEAFLGGSALRDVFAVIQRIGLRDFALLELGDDGMRVVVGGAAVASGGTRVVAVPEDSIAAYREAELPHGVVRVRLADELVLAWSTTPEAARPTSSVSSDAAPPVALSTSNADDESSAAEPAPPPQSSPDVADAPSGPDRDRGGGSDSDSDNEDLALAGVEPSSPKEPAPENTQVPAEPPPSHLDVTYVRPSARAPGGDGADITVHEAPEDEELSQPGQAADVVDLPPPAAEDRHQGGSPEMPPEPGPQSNPESQPETSDGSGLITGVPGMAGGPAPAPSRPSRPDRRDEPRQPRVQRGESDGHTVAAGDLRAKVAAAKAGQTDSGVTSQLCSNGHANPPSTPNCRSCGESLTGQPVVSVPRPVVARLEFEAGLVPPVEVDRTQIIGRRPTARDDQPGLQPGLVTIPDGDREVSGSHLELRVHGWTLDVIDLGSTNGTWIQLPGEEERRMRPDEPEMVRVGTRIRLADVTTFTVVAPQ